MKRKRGTVRKPKHLYLNPALTQEADDLAQSEGQYLSDFVEEAIRQEIKRRKRQP